jgi:transcriptional regulator with XRE-family HTH domain
VITQPKPGGLAAALREWRARRRVSQLDLALRAGTTQRHVSFIESGRSVPGRAMVVRLAESLEVPLRERNALLLAAGYAPAYPETRFDDPGLGPVRAALERILEGHLPCPAVIVDRHGDLLAANDGFGAVTDGVAPELLVPPVSVPRVLLHPRGLAPRIVNFDEWAWNVIDRLHHELVSNPSDRLDDLVSELEALAPDRPRQPGPDYLGFAVPLRLHSSKGELRLLTTLTHFGTAVDVTIAELRLEAFLPADEATAAILTELAAVRYRTGLRPRPGSAHRAACGEHQLQSGTQGSGVGVDPEQIDRREQSGEFAVPGEHARDTSPPADLVNHGRHRRHHHALQHRFLAERQGQVVGTDKDAVHPVDPEDLVKMVEPRARLHHRQQQRLVPRAEQGSARQPLATPPPGREVRGLNQLPGLSTGLDGGHDHAVHPGVQHPRQLRLVVRRKPHEHRHRADPRQRRDVPDLEIAVLHVDPDPFRPAHGACHLKAERAQERHPQPPPAGPRRTARTQLSREARHARITPHPA